MKKFLTIIFTIIMVVTITACGSGSEEEDEKPKETNEIDANAEKLNNMIGENLFDGIKAAKEYDFAIKCISESSGNDMTDYINESDENEIKSYEITDSHAVGGSKSVTFTIANDIDKHNSELKEILSETLDNGHAWLAVENYGKTQYTNGFELNYIAGRISEDVVDENTWFLKAKCEITGADGSSAEMVCEAHVSGTNEAPEVNDFIVY